MLHDPVHNECKMRSTLILITKAFYWKIGSLNLYACVHNNNDVDISIGMKNLINAWYNFIKSHYMGY